jgi:hypothetical protein
MPLFAAGISTIGSFFSSIATLLPHLLITACNVLMCAEASNEQSKKNRLESWEVMTTMTIIYNPATFQASMTDY